MQGEEHRIAMMICTLPKVDDAEDWQAYMGFGVAFFSVFSSSEGVYDHNHPDEFRAGKTPFLLIVADRPIGTVRGGLRNRHDAIVRTVAISKRGKA